MSSDLAFVHSGSYFHLADLADPAIAAFNPRPVYAPDMQPGELATADAVYLGCRQHPEVMARMAPEILAVLARPGTKVVIGGENQVGSWLPGVREEYRETVFWAWRTGQDTTRRLVHPEHAMWRHLNRAAVDWHHHGALYPPEGATPLVILNEGAEETGCIIYHDAASFAGQVVVTTMDPSYHHGSYFMPGATQLLYRLLRWLAE